MVSPPGPLGHGVWLFEVYAHISRSEPRRLTAAFLHCRCPKGKQRHAREGFDFAVPATFANGFFWAKEVLEAYRTLAPARQRLAGLCFSDEGRPWTILEVQETMQQEMSVFLDNPEDLTTYSWRRLAPTVAQLLECKPEEMAALGDWQAKGEVPEVGAMAFHYSSAKYAASIKVKSLIWGATAKLTSNLLWEAIPQSELDAARAPGLAEADWLLRQDRQPMWASSHNFQDVKKRLKLSQQFVEAAQQARQEAEAAPAPQMPDHLQGKVLTATLKNGKAICPDYQTDSCPNEADSCPFGVHLCAVLQKSGRACGGKHGAGVCRIKRAVLAETAVPAAPKPSASLVPAAVGEKAQFGRKRTMASGATDDEVAEAMRSAVKRARGRAAPKTPPKAPAIAAPKTPPKAMATTPSQWRQPQLPSAWQPLESHRSRPCPRKAVRRRQEIPWTCTSKGWVLAQGQPRLQHASGSLGREVASTWRDFQCSRPWISSPRAALQICCFPHGPESRGGVTLPGAQLMTFAAAYSQERNEQWTDVWPAVKNTVWHGDNVLVHCIKGRHRGAYLGTLCRALLEGESIEAANNFVESRRDTELHKVIKDQGMKKWLYKTFQDTAVGTQHPEPQGYAATERSSTHVTVEDGITLCQHKQADGKAKRLVNPYMSTDIYEALAWERPWCDQCLRRAPASWWPPA